jgi:hypothetical protein
MNGTPEMDDGSPDSSNVLQNTQILVDAARFFNVVDLSWAIV